MVHMDWEGISVPPPESEKLARKQGNDRSHGSNGDCFSVRSLKIVEFFLLSYLNG